MVLPTIRLSDADAPPIDKAPPILPDTFFWPIGGPVFVIGTLVVTSDVCLLRERGARGVLKDKPLLSSASGTLDRVRAAGVVCSPMD